MKYKSEFIMITSLHAALYITNNILAYVTLPDLSYDGSWLTEVFGFGWMGAVLTQIFIFMLCSSTFYYSLFMYKTKYPKKKIIEYIPTAIAALGFAGTFTNISVLTVSVSEWFTANFFPKAYVWYIKYLKYRFEPVKPIMVVEAIVFTVSLFIWIRSEYKKYKKETAK